MTPPTRITPTLVAPVLTLLLVSAFVVATPAQADGGFSFGAGFDVGGFHFTLGYRESDHHHYYRTSRALPAPGYRCTDRCYVERGHHYHHASCPVVQAHFRRHGYHPQRLFEVYAPVVSYPPPPVYYRPVPAPYYYRAPSYYHRHRPAPHRHHHRAPSYRRHHHDHHSYGHGRKHGHDRRHHEFRH